MSDEPRPPESAFEAEAERLFVEALELDAGEQAAFLARACAGRPALRARVERLLAAEREAGRYLNGDGRLPEAIPATTDLRYGELDEGPGSRIGKYKLLQKLGEGGMGVVYLAEHLDDYHQRVAVKIIKPGMDSRQVIARFEAERQALALMNHAHIAKVLDGGATASQRPYFVMELVTGVSITEYCKRHRLSTTERLELFLPVCSAVHHAHQKGIIHRDIKPSNVMVTEIDGKPHPVVIDFGVAKAIHQRLTEKTLFTKLGQLIGTPEYMSPEQASLSELDVDIRSDIYSLGVLLYELLVGRTPFDREKLRSKGYDEIRRIIREEDPPKPSTRLSTMSGEERTLLAEHQRADARRLATILRGDMDWIVMKAIEKDRGRRYDTSNELAADVRRYLAGQPVRARPPSVIYRSRKFLHRHYAGFLTVLALAVVLALAGAVSWNRQRQDAAEALVEQLITARPAAVPATLTQLEPALRRARARLRTTAAGDGVGSFRAHLALLPVESGALAAVLDHWSQLPVEEIAMARPRLMPHRDAIVSSVGTNLIRLVTPPATRIRVAALLAAFEPAAVEWPAVAPQVTGLLLQESILELPVWIELFQPVAPHLESPLRDAFAQATDARYRTASALMLSRYLANDIAALVELLEVSDPDQYPYLVASLRAGGTPAVNRLQERFEMPDPDGLGYLRKTRTGLALLQLGAGETVWQAFAVPRPVDPTLRTALIHGFSSFRVAPQLLLERWQIETNSPVRQAVLSALGDYDPVAVGPEQRARLRPALLTLLDEEPDSGVRSMAEWLLVHWGFEDDVRQVVAVGPPGATQRNWFRSQGGLTFTRFDGPVVFPMGAEVQTVYSFAAQRHWRRIPRTFGLATRSVLLRECGDFDGVLRTNAAGVALDVEAPALFTNYTNAVRFCNWLSRREGIPTDQHCYDESRGGAPRPGHLSLGGYRLPSEAEWEYAARAGAATAWHLGAASAHVDAYYWHERNSGGRIHPPGRKRPNAAGLFDVLGNVRQWCDGPFLPYPEDTTPANPFDDGEWSVGDARPRFVPLRIPDAAATLFETTIEVDWTLRGGDFTQPAAQLSLFARDPGQPRTVHVWASVRPARTLIAP